MAYLSTTQYVGDATSGFVSDTTIVAGGRQVLGIGNDIARTSTRVESGKSYNFTYTYTEGGFGEATATIISQGGVQVVGGGGALSGVGIAEYTTIYAGGTQYVAQYFSSFGTAGKGYVLSTLVEGGVEIVGGGEIIDYGYNYYGGAASFGSHSTGYAQYTTITEGGNQVLGDGAFELVNYEPFPDAGFYSAYEYIERGAGYSTNTVISGGGQQTVGRNGGLGYASNTLVEGGTQYVGVGAEQYVSAFFVGYTANLFDFQRTPIYTERGAIGSAVVTTLGAGGTQFVGLEGGTGYASNTVISSGGEQVVGDSSLIQTVFYDHTGYVSFYVFHENYISGVGTSYETPTTAWPYFGEGTATSTVIEGGGTQYIGMGAGGSGLAKDTLIESGGVQVVGGSGAWIDYVVDKGAAYDAGNYDYYILEDYSDTQRWTSESYISATGEAENTTVESGGTQYIGDGSEATSTYVSGGGVQVIGIPGDETQLNIFVADTSDFGVIGLGTAFATSTVVSAAGEQIVGYDHGVGVEIDTVLNEGASQIVGDDYGTGFASGMDLGADTEQFVGEDHGVGYATATVINRGATQIVGVLQGIGTAVSTTVESGGLQIVGDEHGTGYASATMISSGGSQTIGYNSGTGFVTGLLLGKDVEETVGDDYGTGYVTSTVISQGGEQTVGDHSGTGSTTDVVISSGGKQFVGISGGTGYVTSTTISSGGEQIAGVSGGVGNATSTTISGGEQIVGSTYGTGSATDTVLDLGATQYLGYVNGTGSATKTTDNDGLQYVGYRGGTGDVTSTTLSNGALEYLGYSAGFGSAVSTTVTDADQYAGYEGGTGYATATMLSDGGLEFVGYVGGTGSDFSATIGSGGVQYAGYEQGGTGYTTGTVINGGGEQIVGDQIGVGSAASTTINYDGVQIVGVSAGTGYATDTTLEDFSTQYVGDSYGTGSAASTTVMEFSPQYVGYDHGTGFATDTTVSGLGVQYVGDDGTGYATGTTLGLLGHQYVGLGSGTGYATSTTIDTGGIEYIGESGGTGSAASAVLNGGNQFVGYSAGIGYATGTVISGGTQYVGGHSGTGHATGTVIRGGEQVVSTGGSVLSTTIDGGELALYNGAVASTTLINGGTLAVNPGASFTDGQVTFEGGGTLDLTALGTSAFTPVISNFTSNSSGVDAIDVEGSGEAGDKLSLTTSSVIAIVNVNGHYEVGSVTETFLDVETANGSVLQSLTLAGDYSLSDFTLTDPPAVDVITLDLCYLHGTRILTPTGQVAVEDLAAGDTVMTHFGGIQTIKWLGRQRYAPQFIANNPEKWPVCIRAGALGQRMPARDLYVSPGHSMLLGGTLVLASNLVNGITITQTPPDYQVNYLQIELGRHDCVVAEGAWSETYADGPGLRAQFHNAAEYEALFPDEPPAEALRLCAERPQHGPLLAAALLPVVERAAAGIVPGPLEAHIDEASDWRVRGWARDLAHPELPVQLEILTGGQVIGTVLACEFRADLRQAGKGRGYCAFGFTPPFRLRAERLATLAIRRATDGAELPGLERFRPQPEPAGDGRVETVQGAETSPTKEQPSAGADFVANVKSPRRRQKRRA